MCALAMIGIATQAQDNVRYEISSTPATEVVEGHMYVLQNRKYTEIGLAYDGFGARTFDPVSEQLGQFVTSVQTFFFTATADGFTLPVTLDNINDANIDWGYGETGGGTVLSPKRKAADNTVYFTVKDENGQLAMLFYFEDSEGFGLYGVNATTPAESAQWIAYEVKEHEHKWEIVYDEDQSYYHHCTKCDRWENHYVTGEDGVCVCGYQCPEHDYFVNVMASILATKEQGESIMVSECNNCHYQKTVSVETGGECEGNESGHEWDEDNHDPTCAMPGYTVHRCVYCNLEYYTDFTDIDPNNHNWYANSDGHFCNNDCAEHGAWAEHTMEEDKCTVCGYWPGHTEHQWLTDDFGHYCTIPGCEHSEYKYHTKKEGSCACTVCGHIEHQYENGVCQNCGTGCQHEWNDGYCYICYTECEHTGNIVPAAVIPATCTKEGWKEHFECSVCHKLFANEEGVSIGEYYEDLYIEKLGHVIGNDLCCHREGCGAKVTISSTEITLDEAANVDFMNYAINYNDDDPTAEPLYQLVLTQPAQYIFSIPEEILNSFDSPGVSIFNKNFEIFGYLSVDPECTNSAFFEETGTYYLLPSAFGDGEKEFVKRNVPLTIAIVNKITLDPEEITDVDGEPVVITLTDDGYYATEQTIELDDAVNIPYTDIEFSVPAVSYTRDISAYTGNNWGTLCLPFDYTVADATSAGLSIYEFTDASSEAVTVTHKTEGTVKYGTPVLFKKTGEGEGTALTLSATSTKMGFDQGVIDNISGLQLWGTFEPKDVTSGYYLDAKDGKLHSIETYCSEKSKASLPIPAYRAYFAGNVSPSGAPLRINIDDDEATAIAAISALTEGKAEIYDMNGRRIQSLQKGVNIVKYGNGITKKVIIK